MKRTQAAPASTLLALVMLSGGALSSAAAGSRQSWDVQWLQTRIVQERSLPKIGQHHSITAASKCAICVAHVPMLMQTHIDEVGLFALGTEHPYA